MFPCKWMPVVKVPIIYASYGTHIFIPPSGFQREQAKVQPSFCSCSARGSKLFAKSGHSAFNQYVERRNDLRGTFSYIFADPIKFCRTIACAVHNTVLIWLKSFTCQLERDNSISFTRMASMMRSISLASKQCVAGPRASNVIWIFFFFWSVYRQSTHRRTTDITFVGCARLLYDHQL